MTAAEKIAIAMEELQNQDMMILPYVRAIKDIAQGMSGRRQAINLVGKMLYYDEEMMENMTVRDVKCMLARNLIPRVFAELKTGRC